MSRRTYSVLISLVLLVSIVPVLPAGADHTPSPTSVTIAGSLQAALGCPGDWQPECAVTHLTYDADDDVWQGTFDVPAGAWEYKAALNDSWDENYGAGGAAGGDNIALNLSDPTTVKFYYDHGSHWVTDDVNATIATVAGSFQSELGCPDDWQPWCLRSWMQDADGDGVYEFASTEIPAGSYEFKVALDEAWDTSYPGSNVPFTSADGDLVTFAYDSSTNDVSVTVGSAPPPGPSSVTIAGDLQEELGCPGDWQPECAVTHLTYDAGDDVWQDTFPVPAGDWQYKAALNDSWDENYGAGGVQNGDNIPLSLGADADVKFYYDDETHWVTDNVNSTIATFPGSFQDELGCPGEWQPDCLRSWLQDPDGDGVYEFATGALPPGDYEGKVAIDESWDVNYGVGGEQNGANLAFSVTADTVSVTFSWDSATNVPTIAVDDGSGLEPGDEALVTDPVRQPGSGDTIYFLLTDRFEDGSDANDTGGDTSGDPLVNGYLVDDKGYYHGGDVAGLTSRIGYLADLGVTAVWMTPPFTNDWVQGNGTIGGSSAGYHGYWQTDYENIDPHLGTNQEMKDFIAAAHAAGIKVYFDVVVNHTGDIIQYAEGSDSYINKATQPYRDAAGNVFDDRDFAGGDTFPPLDPAVSFPYTPTFAPGDDTAKNPAWLNDPIFYHNRGNSTFAGESSLYGDFFGLDDLFTEHPEVVNGMIDIHKNMITEFGVDGFRVDTAKHVNDELWEQWVPAILDHAAAEGNPDFVLFGEVFGETAEFRARYSTELPFPATLDFGFDGEARQFAAASAPTGEIAGMFADFDDYYTDTDSNAYGLVKFMGNHDIGRLGLDIVNNNAGATDDELVARVQLAQALNLFTRGTPVVYYGDEQGFVGDGGDKDARQDMFPSQVASYNDDDLIGTASTTADSNFDQSHPIYSAVAEMAAIRESTLALQQGAQLIRHFEDTAGIFAFSRIDRTEQVEYVVALNNSESDATASFDTDSADTTFTAIYPDTAPDITTSGEDFTVTVPALGVVVYMATDNVTAALEAPGISLVAPEAGSDVAGLAAVEAIVGGDDYAEVTFAVSVAGGDYEVIGVDDNAPYRVFYDVSGLAIGTELTFKAIVKDFGDNLNADKVTVTVGEEEEPPTPGGEATYAIIHYFREDGDYGDHTTGDFNDFWGLHLWGDAIDPSEVTDWPNPKPFLGEDEYGRFAWVKLADPTQPLNFIVHRGDVKDGTQADRFFIPGVSPEIWLKQDDGNEYTSQAEAQGYVTIHYHRDDGDYGTPSADFTTFWGLHLWGDAIDPSEGTDWTSPKPPTGIDDYGAYWEVLLADPDAQFNYIIHRGDDKDPGPDEFFTPSQQATVWKQSMDEALYRTRAAAENTAIIHYHRPDGDYGDPTSPDFADFWGLHVWTGAAAPNPSWQEPVRPAGQDIFGIFFEVPLVDGATELAYIIHRGDDKDPGPDQFLDLATYGHEVWQLSGADPEDPYILPIVAGGAVSLDNLDKQQAYWVDERTIVWPTAEDPDATYTLHWSATASLATDEAGITGGDGFIELQPAGLYTGVEGFLHLDGMPAGQIEEADRALIPTMLKGQVAVAATNADGVRIDATGLQIPGVLDDLFFSDGELGVVWHGDVPTIELWAPTAQSVTFHLFADSDPATTSTTTAMDDSDGDGVWSVTGDPSWRGQYYLYEIDVYAPSTGAIETNIVTDPYSLSLAMNSARSQIVDLSDPALAPAGWNGTVKPELEQFEDIAIYELHVRDFSANDGTVPEEYKGTYKAFTLEGTHGMDHLESLAEAGLTHVHLLPTFDIATINEDKSTWQQPDPAVLATYPPDSDQQQAAVEATADLDAFNWGYDPFHYTTPEGSYATNPDGATRIVEYREMVQGLNDSGLRVVMDVVYNHTNASGQAEKSVLDKVVPGYFHRLNGDGVVETSTCCANTATEHAMMEKLMVDSVVTWARDYKVDGFRFDLMGHHSKANMLEVRAALDALTLDDDGVDGASIYIYGEGWNFGEVANNARFTQATQLEMGGTGIGTFSDRLRDAVRGGGPFDGGTSRITNQGFINGLVYDPNAQAYPPATAEAESLLSADQIRVGLAGNLAAYEFEAADGMVRRGEEIDYNGSPAGYTEDPQENIVYISAHDNETLFDVSQYKHPLGVSTADRARAQNVGLDITALAQGVNFFHAGVDMLRSKSMDRDSFNSGDWFNRLDFTYQSNNWAVGLPVASKNQAEWPVMQPFLSDAAIAPVPADIAATVAHMREILEIRGSSPLFTLETAADVQDRVAFHNTGPGQVPGLIVMSLSDKVGDDLDPDAAALYVVFNANDEAQSFTVGDLAGLPIALHEMQASSADPVVQGATFDAATGTFDVPARTTAVFVEEEPDTEPPAVTAELEPVRVRPHVGTFIVRYSCSDDRDPAPTVVATLNGVPVPDGQHVLLIQTPHRVAHVEIGRLLIMWGPEFELVVTCTDAAGNSTTATAVAEFRPPGPPSAQ